MCTYKTNHKHLMYARPEFRPKAIGINDRFVFSTSKGSKHYVVYNVRWYILAEWKKKKIIFGIHKGVYLHEVNYISFLALPEITIYYCLSLLHVIMSCCIRLIWLDCFSLFKKIFKYGRYYYIHQQHVSVYSSYTIDCFFLLLS